MDKNKQAKILAQTIYQLLAGQTKTEAEKLIANFSRYLADKKLVSLIPKILTELKNFNLAATNTILVKVSAKNKLPAGVLQNIKKVLTKKLAKKIELTSDQDESLLAGAVIKYDDKVIDLSLKKQVNNLSNHLIK